MVSQLTRQMGMLSTVNSSVLSRIPKVAGEFQFAKRPALGVVGKPVNILTNFYPVKYPTLNVMHYHVEVLPKKFDKDTGEATVIDTKDLRKALPSELMKAAINVVALRLKWRSAWAYDGRANIYAAEHLVDGKGLAKDKRSRFDVELASVSGGKFPRRYEYASTV